MQIGEMVTKFEWQRSSQRGPKFRAKSEAKLSKEMQKRQMFQSKCKSMCFSGEKFLRIITFLTQVVPVVEKRKKKGENM